MDRLLLDAPAERRRFLDRIALSLIPGHAVAALAYDKALRERNRLLRGGNRDRSWYGALEAQMAEHGARLGANRRAALAAIAAAARQVAGASATDAAVDHAPAPAADDADSFPAAHLALESEAPAAAADLAAALAENRGRDLAAGRSLLGPHRDDLAAVYGAKDVPARLCSTGEQNALLLSLILANARAVAEGFGAPPILILDEIAAHLDAHRRAALFERVLALGAQAFMTGTDPALFDALGDRAERLALTETGGLSQIARAS
ncbi:hypothetical protein BH23PSE1_BH23PSE1_09000 [soil metagenome]